jgi:hypothetical protein
MWEMELSEGDRPIGYRALVEQFKISAIPHFRWSYVSTKWDRRDVWCEADRLMLCIYPPSYGVKKDPFQHLEFALKHEGVNLTILKKVLEHLGAQKVAEYIKESPTSKYARVIWFLYEGLLDQKLELPDAKQGAYVLILNPEEYYTTEPQRSQRHRVLNNLLGFFEFCPVVRKSSLLQAFSAKKLADKARALTRKYSPEILARAMQYLYTKETLSSWEIERERPDQKRLTQFTALLGKAGQSGPLSKQRLIDLQNQIVDVRFGATTYRDFQNYVGEEPTLQRMVIHYISPRPEDVESLMEGLLNCFDRMVFSGVDPVVIAAVLSFGFVFIHPFEDGNGRLHRFLIHYVLARCGFTPPEVVFPISALMVREMGAYDAALESFSMPLKERIKNFHLSANGEMKVLEETADYYRFMDFTLFAEYLFACIERTIEVDFEQELEFLTSYYQIKKQLREIVDMPDRKIDLFIQCVRQNQGALSAKKRESYFSMLTDSEIGQMEAVIKNLYQFQKPV